jgi:hypothetical protein
VSFVEKVVSAWELAGIIVADTAKVQEPRGRGMYAVGNH